MTWNAQLQIRDVCDSALLAANVSNWFRQFIDGYNNHNSVDIKPDRCLVRYYTRVYNVFFFFNAWLLARHIPLSFVL